MIYIIQVKKLKTRRKKFSPMRKMSFRAFILSFLTLTLIGRKPVEDPYFSVGKVARVAYFSLIMM
jgi:Cytochrome b(C-terminal)/b6/petD